MSHHKSRGELTSCRMAMEAQLAIGPGNELTRGAVDEGLNKFVRWDGLPGEFAKVREVAAPQDRRDK